MANPKHSQANYVRRRDRSVDDDAWITAFLQRAAVGSTATVVDGQPFINTNLFVYDQARDCIYIHTAQYGRTRSNFETGEAPRVCFSVMEMEMCIRDSGHSMGGMTALAVAANHPGLIHAAVLEDPPFMLPNPYIVTEEMAAQFRADVRDTLALHDLPLADRIARCRAEQPHWPDEEVLPWAESKGEFDPEILQQRTRFRAYPWRDALSRVSCPLLLITADVVEGALIIPELADAAAQRCPTCEVAHIAGAGHSIHRDRSVEMLRRVRSFFGRLMPA